MCEKNTYQIYNNNDNDDDDDDDNDDDKAYNDNITEIIWIFKYISYIYY